MVLSFVHLVLNHSSAYTVFCLHFKVSKNSVSRGPPVLWKLCPSQIDTKTLSWISIRFPIRNNFFGKSIDIIQQKTLPRRYFPFLLFSCTFLGCTFSGSPFWRWIFPGKLNWAWTQRANKRVHNILKVQIMFEQLIKHWFMEDWHENST